LLTGNSIVGVSIARIPAIKSFETSTNFTAAYIPTVMWSDIEVEVGIVCACLPSLRALVMPLFNKSKKTTTPSDVGPSNERNPYQTVGSKDSKSAWRSKNKGKMGLADVTLNSTLNYDEEARSESQVPLYATGDVQMVPIPPAAIHKQM
jgi:hypothetical protein